MIRTLEERLQEHKETYLKMKAAEHVAERYIKELRHFLDEGSNVTVYDGSVYFYLYPASIDVAELNFIPAISDLYGPHWTKTVNAEEVSYRFHKYDGETFLSINVQPKVKGTCRIIAKATGKIKRVHKYVDIDEPEVEYLVDCDTEDAQDA